MSFDKTVKNACKPKKDPPKGKYLDPLIAATHTTDGAMVDICRALGARLREPNNIIVFKALLVLHSMIRQGATDNVLGFLSGNDVLRLKGNVANQSWDGYSATQSLKAYANYLDSRIQGYKGLKHDPVRVQSENNRASAYDGASAKGRKLNSLSVDKGLLREVREVQKMVGCLIQCRFFDDDLEDPCIIMAFRLIVKDLLVLTQAINEGVVNLLEHYFEMAKTDAHEALSIYKAFVKQNDKVVEYLNTAKGLSRVLDVPIPNLRHAPNSLVRALEEYLNDPNFEQNRLEYRQNMSAADVPTTTKAPSPAPAATATSSKAKTPEPAPAPPAPAAQQQVNRSIQDFFTSIEEEQKQNQGGMGSQNSFMGGMGQMGQPGMPGGFTPQQPQANPFRQSMFPQATGFGGMPPQMTGFPSQPFQANPTGMIPQQTGFLQPQAAPQNAFVQPQQTGFQASQPAPFQPTQSAPFQAQQTGFLQPQPTGMFQPQQQPQSQPTGPFAQSAPLQPQATGFNPFRQSMLMPQSTGLPFRSPNSNAFQPSDRSASAPSQQANEVKPLTAQQTGTNNPFALPSDRQPKKAAPSGPSLFEMAMHKSMANNAQFSQPQTTGSPFGQQNATPAPLAPQATGFAGSSIVPFSSRMGGSPLPGQSGGNTPAAFQEADKTGGNGYMSDLASAFATTSTNDKQNQPDQNANAGSSNVSGLFGSGLFSQGTGTTNTSGSHNLFSQTTGTTAASSAFPSTPSSNFLQPQPTGFAGSSVKPFKPSSNFGSTLVTDNGVSPNPTGSSGSPFGMSMGGNTTGSGGMQPQATGFNPFGTASMMNGQKQVGNNVQGNSNNNSNNNDQDLMSLFGGPSSQPQQPQQQQQSSNTNWMSAF